MKIKFENVEEDFVKNFAKAKCVPSSSLVDTKKAIMERAFTVTGVGSQDLVETIHSSLVQAMEQKLSYSDFYNFLETGLKAKGFLASEMFPAYRWQTIYRTNVKTVFERGRFDRMMTLRDVYPYRRFVAVDDERTTETCRDLNGAIAYWASELYLNNQAPRHFNCRSTWVLERNPSLSEVRRWQDTKIRAEEGFGQHILPEDLIDQLNIGLMEKGLVDEWERGREIENEIENEDIEEYFNSIGAERSETLQYELETEWMYDEPGYSAKDQYQRIVERLREAKKRFEDFFYDYETFGYERINAYLRGMAEEGFESIAEEVEKYLKEDWNKTIGMELKVYRGIKFEDARDFMRFLDHLQNGILDKGFASTSLSRGVAYNFGYGYNVHSVFLELKVNSSSYALHGDADEVEVILNPNTFITVERVVYDKTVDGTYVVKVIGEVYNESP